MAPAGIGLSCQFGASGVKSIATIVGDELMECTSPKMPRPVGVSLLFHSDNSTYHHLVMNAGVHVRNFLFYQAPQISRVAPMTLNPILEVQNLTVGLDADLDLDMQSEVLCRLSVGDASPSWSVNATATILRSDLVSCSLPTPDWLASQTYASLQLSLNGGYDFSVDSVGARPQASRHT